MDNIFFLFVIIIELILLVYFAYSDNKAEKLNKSLEANVQQLSETCEKYQDELEKLLEVSEDYENVFSLLQNNIKNYMDVLNFIVANTILSDAPEIKYLVDSSHEMIKLLSPFENKNLELDNEKK